MKIVEFNTKFNSRGQIIIPNSIRRKIKRDYFVKVIIYDGAIEENDENTVNYDPKPKKRSKSIKDYKTPKDFWEDYQFNGIWNGE